MKKTFTKLLVFTILLISQTTFAQVTEITKRMSMGEQYGFTCNLETNNKKGIEKVWKEYFKEFGKTSKNRKANEWQSKSPVPIPKSSQNTYDVYFKLVEEGDILEAFLWVDTGDYFVNKDSNAEEAEKIKTMFTVFTKKAEVYIVEELLDKESDILKDIEKKIKKLEKNNAKYHKKVDNAKATIIEYEEMIEQNIIDQTKKNEEVDIQRKRVQKVRDNLNKLD